MIFLFAFMVSIDPCEQVKIPDNLIEYHQQVDERPFIVRLIASITIKELSLFPPKIQIKGGTDF